MQCLLIASFFQCYNQETKGYRNSITQIETKPIVQTTIIPLSLDSHQSFQHNVCFFIALLGTNKYLFSISRHSICVS